MPKGFNWRPKLEGDPPLCACGCGKPVKRNGRRWNKYLHNHHWSGKQRQPFSDEHRAKISACVKKQHVDNHPTRGKRCAAGSLGKLGAKNPHFGKRGAATPNWKGGHYIQNGYLMHRVVDHPKARNGYVCEHVLVVEKMLGRYLDDSAVVHHINGDKSDNREENLFVITRSGHRQAHTSIQNLIYKLVQSGEIVFNHKLGCYEFPQGRS